MKIEEIIYNTTREVLNVSDKLSIATPFIFCLKKDSMLFSELLYSDDYERFIDKLNEDYDADFSINFSNINVKNAFLKTRELVIEKRTKTVTFEHYMKMTNTH